MRHWADFQPRSLCGFSDGGPDSSSGDTSGGGVDSGGSDTSGFFSGNTTGGDFFGGGGGGFQGTNDAGGFVSAGPSADTSGFTPGGDITGGQTFADNSFNAGGGQNFATDVGSGMNFAPDGGGGGMNFGANDYGAFPGGMSPTGGVDFTAGSQFAAGQNPFAGSNYGAGGAIGPPGWATGDYGTYSTGGPTSTGQGPGAGPSVGGPSQYAAAPGVSGFPGDFGAPPGGAFGMPGGGQAGPQAGPGMPGGPSNVGNAEPGFMPVAPEVPTTVTPSDQRGENFFGPESLSPTQQTTSSVFGPSQALAADRGTDQGIISQNILAGVNLAGDMNSQMAQANPALAEALNAWAANQQAGMGQLGPGMPTLTAGPGPGAQQGFTGVSAAQQAASGPFTGQPSMGSESTQGKGDRGDTTPMVTAYPGVQPGAQNPAADPALLAGLETRADAIRGGMLAPDLPSQTAQTDTFDSRFGNLPAAVQAQSQPTTQQAIDDAFQQLAQSQQQQSMQQAAPFDAQALGEQGRAGQPQQADTFDSRFGNLPAAQQAQPDTFDSRFSFPTTSQTDTTPQVDPNIMEAISKAGPELTTGLIGPQTQGVGRDAAPLGLLSMMGSRAGGEAAPFGGGRAGAFGPTSGGRTSDSRPDSQLSITVSPNQFAGRGGGPTAGGRSSPGYYMTGGAGIAPGAKGAEYGGIYGPGVATGRPGTNTFGIDSRSGAQGFYDARTGLYYR